MDTITAIATAGGISSISIVRISGDAAKDIIANLVPKALFKPRYIELRSIYNKNNELIDKALVVYFKAPHSFTGEDIVEIQCHGGIVVANEILESVIHYGARVASPGEFSKRAFLNGKIDLSEAEAIAKLIEAKSADAAKILARQLKGELGKFVNTSREALLRALAYSEVMIDYAEEDTPDDILSHLINQLDDLLSSMRKIVQSSHRRKGLIDGFKVAIVGKPNVGKSSLLNAFLASDRAIVSDIAGTTRDTVEEQVRIGSHLIRLVDTAGIRDAVDQIEQIGIERSMSSIEEADAVIALFDNSCPFDYEDQKILNIINGLKKKELIVAINKSDLKPRLNISNLKGLFPITISTKENFEDLANELKRRLDNIVQSDDLMLISTRQIESVESCCAEIDLAKQPLVDGKLEFFSYHIQEAVKHISSITRPYNNEEMLDKMFGEFCLGK